MSVFVVRVILADRPGALGAVASRIGAVRGDVVGVEILERNAGEAVDEFLVELADPDQLSLLASEIEEVDGVSVEAVSPIPDDRRDSRLACYEAAAALMAQRTPEAVLSMLAELARQELDATWAAVVETGDRSDGTPGALFSVGRVPAEPWLSAYVSDLLASQRQPAPDLATAIMASWDLAVVAGRPGRRFAELERRRLEALASVADARWSEVSRSCADAHPSRPRGLASATSSCPPSSGLA